MVGWPFWAATSDERIDHAFDLAELGPGQHLVDLGCGDGRVLLRAGALRGARVTGVELDPDLAESARELLAAHDIVDGTVIEADFAAVDLDDADVVFAYLSPATLQRLRPRLDALRPGTRVVTTGYAMPGWEPTEVGSRCFLYRVPAPATVTDPDRRGWSGAGALVAVGPDAPSLVAVKLHHAGGPVDVALTSTTDEGALTIRTGADGAGPGEEVVVDLSIAARPEGTTFRADLGLHAGDGVQPFAVFVAVDAGAPGVWGLPVAGVDAVRHALAAGDVAGILADARRALAG